MPYQEILDTLTDAEHDGDWPTSPFGATHPPNPSGAAATNHTSRTTSMNRASDADCTLTAPRWPLRVGGDGDAARDEEARPTGPTLDLHTDVTEAGPPEGEHAANPDTQTPDPGQPTAAVESPEPAASEMELSEERLLIDNEPVDDVVRMWLREVGRTPLLETEHEVILAKRIERGAIASRALRNRDRNFPTDQRATLVQLVERGHSARERLTSANLRLVVAVAKRYVGRGLTFGDLIQEGNLGLLRAVEKYDYRRGFKFSTYATWWIRQSITRAIADQGRTIRVPVHMVEFMNRVLRAQNTLSQVLGRDATMEEVADHVGLSTERVREVLSVIPEPMSLETPLGDDDEAHLSDFLVDSETASPSEALSRKATRDQLQALMRDALSPRECEVIAMRYGLRDGHTRTLEEVGTAVGVTRERIRQIEARAMKKLRHPSRTSSLHAILGDG